jgi:glutamyl-tRNA synthetase
MALQLMHNKKAFSCFCSDNWLDKKREEAKEANKQYSYDDACRNLPDELVIDNTNPFTIRIKKPNEVSSDFKDLDSFIIMRQDKTPTYDFACCVSDMLNDISVIISVEDDTNNKIKQDYIRKSLGYEKEIQYIHLPIMLNDDFSVKSLLEDGYLPEAISNYLISISNQTPTEIFNMKEAIEFFDVQKISKSPALFDIETLKEINKKHLKNLDVKELSRYVGFADTDIGELARVYLQEVATTKELKSKIKAIFADKEIPKEFLTSANIMMKTIKDAPYFEQYNDFKKYVMKESKVQEDEFSKTLRYILTGVGSGPDIAEIYEYLKNYIGEIVK